MRSTGLALLGVMMAAAIGAPVLAPYAGDRQFRGRFNAPPTATDWTVMIKDAKGSADGWYWAEIWDKQCADNNDPPFAVRNAGFGLYCTRCHASAESEPKRIASQRTRRHSLCMEPTPSWARLESQCIRNRPASDTCFQCGRGT